MKKIIITVIITLLVVGTVYLGVSAYKDKDVNAWLDITVNRKETKTYEEYVANYEDRKLTEEEFKGFIDLENRMTPKEKTQAFIRYQFEGGEDILYLDYINMYSEYNDYERYSKKYDDFLADEKFFNEEMEYRNVT